jgi:hypothetical protein
VKQAFSIPFCGCNAGFDALAIQVNVFWLTRASTGGYGQMGLA